MMKMQINFSIKLYQDFDQNQSKQQAVNQTILTIPVLIQGI
jgi:hypothetical protein